MWINKLYNIFYIYNFCLQLIINLLSYQIILTNCVIFYIEKLATAKNYLFIMLISLLGLIYEVSTVHYAFL